MLSGIGDPKELWDANIKTVIPLPGVGKNLRDHLISAKSIVFLRP
nr:GMC family oxidoreductase N-terminal domain-containing protein [Pseudorhodoplanes sinuspersici]